MERKQEEQARQMKDLQGWAERLQCENDQLRAQIGKSHHIGKDARDSGRDAQLISRDKGKRPVVPDDVNTLADDELSSGSSPSLNLSSAKNTRESIRTRSCKRPLPHPSFNDAISGASCRVRREVGRRHYRFGQAPGNQLVLPSGMLPLMLPAHPAFGTTPMFYISPAGWHAFFTPRATHP